MELRCTRVATVSDSITIVVLNHVAYTIILIESSSVLLNLIISPYYYAAVLISRITSLVCPPVRLSHT